MTTFLGAVARVWTTFLYNFACVDSWQLSQPPSSLPILLCGILDRVESAPHPANKLWETLLVCESNLYSRGYRLHIYLVLLIY